MNRGDWRSPDAYESLRSLDAPAFAWEFLHRNPNFQQALRTLERASRRGVLTSADIDVFAQRWGIRCRSWLDKRGRCGLLGCSGAAHHNCSDGSSQEPG